MWTCFTGGAPLRSPGANSESSAANLARTGTKPQPRWCQFLLIDGWNPKANHLGWCRNPINNGIIIILGGWEWDFSHQQYHPKSSNTKSFFKSKRIQIDAFYLFPTCYVWYEVIWPIYLIWKYIPCPKGGQRESFMHKISCKPNESGWLLPLTSGIPWLAWKWRSNERHVNYF